MNNILLVAGYRGKGVGPECAIRYFIAVEWTVFSRRDAERKALPAWYIFLASVDFISYNSSSFFIKFISNRGKLYFWIRCEQNNTVAISNELPMNYGSILWLNTHFAGKGEEFTRFFLPDTREFPDSRNYSKVNFGRNFSPFCPNKTFLDYRTLAYKGSGGGKEAHFCVRMAPREFRWRR